MTAAAIGTPRRRRRRGLRVVLVVLLVLVVLAVVAAFVGERIFRDRAEAQIADTVNATLPDGVEGDFTASIGGSWTLLQYLHGEFDDVTLRSRGLEVAGAQASAVVHLSGLPVDGGRVQLATARLTVGQAAFRDLPPLRRVGASDPVLGSGTLSTTLKPTILGVPITVGVTMKPSVSGQVVSLTPSAATLTAGPATVPALAIVRQLLPNGVSVCAASYLPRPVQLTSLKVTKGELTVSLAAPLVDPTNLDTKRVGSCD